MKMKFFTLLFATFVMSCGDDNTDSTDEPDDTDEVEEPTSNPPNVLGMDYTQSAVSVGDAYSALRGTLEGNPNISIVAEVDHEANAASVDLDLKPDPNYFLRKSEPRYAADAEKPVSGT